MSQTFEEVKKAYVEKREEERVKLKNYLKNYFIEDDRITVSSYGGKGRPNYTSGGELKSSPFNLNNWKWVEVRQKEEKLNSCIISLNMLEEDNNSGNKHALYDRVGFIVHTKNKEPDIMADRRSWITSIELPLEDSDKEKIAQIVKAEVLEKMWNM